MFLASLDHLSTHQLNWESALNTLWCGSAPVVLYNMFLLTAGGRQPSDYATQTCEVHVLSSSSNQWDYLANIPAARHFSAAVSVGDGMIIAIGVRTQNIPKLYGLVSLNNVLPVVIDLHHSNL